jgi:hypothetical protein
MQGAICTAHLRAAYTCIAGSAAAEFVSSLTTPACCCCCCLLLPTRYLSEDLPFGLVPMKGVAELLGVPATPWFDRVITWGQQLIGKVRSCCGCVR